MLLTRAELYDRQQILTSKGDISNKKFRRLTVIKEVERKHGYRMVECLCDCGETINARIQNVLNGNTNSCGCYMKDRTAETHYKHGGLAGEESPEYRTWQNIKSRCYNKNRKDYLAYGAKGITVCDEWLNSFPNFLKDMGNRPSIKHSIERVNNLLGYSKDNCIWATKQVQNNNKSSNLVIEFNGIKKTLAQWAKFMNASCAENLRRMMKSKSFEECYNYYSSNKINKSEV